MCREEHAHGSRQVRRVFPHRVTPVCVPIGESLGDVAPEGSGANLRNWPETEEVNLLVFFWAPVWTGVKELSDKA